MDFTYVASGGVQIFGCADYSESYAWNYEFAVGSIVFSKPKALKGVYEKIAIKKVKWIDDYTAFYTDTFNAHWNQDELVSYDTAKALVKHYIDVRNAALENLVRNC